LKVDTEANPQLAARFQITSIPTFAVFRGGQLVHRQPGLMRAPQLQALVLGAARAA
jgi:thioredoxin-like negative regulator of GroEL